MADGAGPAAPGPEQPGAGLGFEPLKTLVQALQGFLIARQRGMRVGDRRLGLFGPSQHPIGAHELDPARDVGSVLLQTLGQPLDHRLDGAAIMFGRRDRRGRRGRGNERRAFLVDPRQRVLDHRQPFGALAGARHQRGPPLHRLVAAAFLLGAEPEIILRHHVFGIGGVGALEQALGLRGHHAVGGHDDGFAEIAEPRGVRTEDLQRVAPRPDGIVEASETKIDRRQQFPAAPVLGIGSPDISRPRRRSARSLPEAAVRRPPRSSKRERDSAIPAKDRSGRRRAAAR